LFPSSRISSLDLSVLPGLETGVVPIAVVEIGDRHIRLLDPADHLVVELALEGLGRLHQGVGVGILGLEVIDDLGIGPLVEPVVIVDPGLAVDGQFLADLLGQRRL
jgi:hypothetical protein